MFDIKGKGMTEFEKNMDYIVNNMPKEAKMILRKGGSKARTIVARKARQLVKKHTGTYHKRFKRGKVWQLDDGTYRVRVYNNSPHAHLIEDGHRIVGKDGSEHGLKLGYKVLDKSNKEVEKQWDQILEKEIDNLLEKL